MIHEFGGPSVMHVAEVSEPGLAPGEVLIDVHHAGLNPLDYKMRDGSSGLCPNMTLPCSLGREFAGQVLAGAFDVDLDALGIPVGSWVFGLRANTDLRGCYGERITVDASTVAPIPAGGEEDLVAFAGLALVGSTAVGTLNQARIAAGETVLIHGGSGGVGQLLIPMALQRGASTVWATGRAANAQRIRELGAEPIPYDAVNWREYLLDATAGHGVDVIIDTHYFQTFLPSLDHLADGGRIVALPTLADLTPAKQRGIDASISKLLPTRDVLDELASGYVNGLLPLEVSEVLPLADVRRGHEQLESGHTRGKLILDVRS